MKTTLVLIFLMAMQNASSQLASTSFEEPQSYPGSYTDTGDPNVSHPLLDNPDEPIVNWVGAGASLGFQSRYIPYDNPGVGLTDGDPVGVSDSVATIGMYPDGAQGFRMSDCDGNFILEFDPVDLSGVSNPTVSIDFFIAATGYEGDGTENVSGSDRLRIYVKDLTLETEIDLLDTTGSDINDLGIEDSWITETADLTANSQVQLVIEARNNSAAEAFFFDHVRFEGTLATPNSKKPTISIFPNPVKDILIVQSNSSDPKEIKIFDVLGKMIWSRTTAEDILYLDSWKSGLYFIQIRQGSYSSTQKLVVQ